MIKVNTHYPHQLTININHDKEGNFGISWKNRDCRKINNIEILHYFSELIKDIDPKNLKKEAFICCQKDFIWLENIRDTFCGRIDEMIKDKRGSVKNKIGAFGDIVDKNKPIRGLYWKVCQERPNICEMNVTKAGGIKLTNYEFDQDNSLFMNPIDLKQYKYIIDLPGHCYSTKIFWKLFLKRVVFYVPNSKPSAWESTLIPWVHYIPVATDLSDMIEKYNWAEAHSEECQKIINNAYSFAIENLTKEKIISKFCTLISS